MDQIQAKPCQVTPLTVLFYYSRTGPRRRVPPPSPRVATTRAAARPTDSAWWPDGSVGGAGGAPLQARQGNPRESDKKRPPRERIMQYIVLLFSCPFLVFVLLFFCWVLFFDFFAFFAIFIFCLFSIFGTSWLARFRGSLGPSGAQKRREELKSIWTAPFSALKELLGPRNGRLGQKRAENRRVWASKNGV